MNQQSSITSKKRRINFRSFLLIAMCMAASILLSRLFFASSIAALLLVFALSLTLIILAIFYYRKKHDVVKCVCLTAAVVLSIVTFIISVAQVRYWNPDYFQNGKIYQVSGEVASNTIVDGNRTIVLDGISLSGVSYKGKIRVYVKEADGKTSFAKEGDILSFAAKVKGTDVFCNYRSGQRYYASVSDDEISMQLGKPSFFQSIRIKIRSVLKDNLKEEYAEISYSMITGDKNFLASDITSYYRASGLAHILAVSGLHVGFVTLLIGWTQKKLGANRIAIFIMVSLALIFYVFVADFSPSVLRAAIMSIMGLATTIKGARRDSLNNLCLAMSAILFFKPLYLFDVGFLMSAFAVVSIIMFVPPIVRALEKIKFPRFLAVAIAVPVAAQVGIIPVTLYFFGTFSIYSILANILLMQIITVSFMLLIVGVTLCAIIPAFGFVIKIAGLGLFVIDETAKLIAALPFSRLIVFTLLPIFVCYAIYFVASRFVRKGKHASLISAVCMVICACMVVAFNFSYDINSTITPVTTALYDVTSVVSVDDEVYIIGDVQNAGECLSALTAIRAKKIDAVFINRLNEKTAYQLLRLASFCDDFAIYFPLEQKMTGLDLISPRFAVKGYSAKTQITDKISCEFDEGGKFLCYKLTDQTTTLFLGIATNLEKVPNSLIKEADAIRSYEFVDPAATQKTYLPNIWDANDQSTIQMQESSFVIYNYKTQKTKQVRR